MRRYPSRDGLESGATRAVRVGVCGAAAAARPRVRTVGNSGRVTAALPLPTEPIGSIPRPPELIAAISAAKARSLDADPELAARYTAAIRDTLARFEATGSPVITDGEQRKYHNFWTYSVHGVANTGVIAPIDPRIETAEEVRDRVLEAARYIPLDQLGTTDDCGFSPFFDDLSTSRNTAFAKVAARVRGTALASAVLGVD